MVPSRPWRAVSGTLEALANDADDVLPHRQHRTGVDASAPVVARGWIVDDRDANGPAQPIEQAWLLIDGEPAFALSVERRADVAALFGPRSRGFAGRGTIAAASGKRTFGILGRASDGSGLTAAHHLTRTVAQAPLPQAPPQDERSLKSDSVMLLREDAGARQSDRDRHDLRAGSELLVRGHVVGHDCAYVRVRSEQVDRWYDLRLDSPRFAGDVRPDSLARFETYVRTSDLPPDGYRADLYAGTPARPTLTAQFVISVDDALPLALHAFADAPPAEIERLRTAVAVAHGADAASESFTAGEPVWIEGVMQGRVAAAFATVDDLRSISISHAETSDGFTRFAGVLQTTKLSAGLHRVEIRLVPPTGNGYYVAGSLAFTLAIPPALAATLSSQP